jgi:hypothetical protein
MQFTLRNVWKFLYDPGWMHGRMNTLPQFKGGHHFPFGGITTAGRGTVGDRTPGPSFKEASFIPISRQSEWLKQFYYEIEMAWDRYYHPLTLIAFYLTALTWISTLIGLASRIFRPRTLARWSVMWLSDRVVPASLGITMLYLVNMGITAAFEDPRYRYDFDLLMFKVMLAGIGCAVLLHLLSTAASAIMARHSNALPPFVQKVLSPANAGVAPASRARSVWPERHLSTSWGFLAILTIAGFWGWANSLTSIAVAEPAEGTISVVSASFGTNCGASKDNALQYVRSACTGKRQCTYSFDWREIGNPARTCAKQFQVEWTCSRSGSILSLRLPPDPLQGTPVSLDCR